MNSSSTIYLATRGSALALAQANTVLNQCQSAWPELRFELKIIKTTGDKLQTASMAREGTTLPKGLFTKELEVALLDGSADLAVHSLKDLPTELPQGLALGAVSKREDVRDVLLFRDAAYAEAASTGRGEALMRGFKHRTRVAEMPAGTVVATSSTRRKAQLAVQNPGLQLPDIRGNVATRMEKLARRADLDATVLAFAGMRRLGFHVGEDGRISGPGVPAGLLAAVLDLETMLPCVGQGAVGIEVRSDDERTRLICERLNDSTTHACVTAERAFLAAMGGGCQSPVAAYAEPVGEGLRIRAVSFTSGPMRRAEAQRAIREASELGVQIAAMLKP